MITNHNRQVSYSAPVTDHFELAMELNHILASAEGDGTKREHLRQLLAMIDRKCIKLLALETLKELGSR